jgi:hypothetical protein
VYQEFISANLIHVVAGPVAVSWTELASLVEFFCNDVDDFMERIRMHFESQITHEMVQKEREERTREEAALAEKRQRDWQREQRRRSEKEAIKKKEQDETRRLRREEEDERRRSDARKEANRLYQENQEKYKHEKELFEHQRLEQWRAALEIQVHERGKFYDQQLLEVQFETNYLQNLKRSTTLVTKPREYLRINRKLRELRRFEEEIVKPIDQQIRAITQFVRKSTAHHKLDKECGGRLYDRSRRDALRNLDTVPKDPRVFLNDALRLPIAPIPLSTTPTSSPHVGETHPSPQQGETRSPSNLSSPKIAAQRAWGLNATVTSITESAASSAETDTKLSEGDSSNDEDEEAPTDQQDTALQARGTHREVKQRNQISQLQDDLALLDRTALASMVKGRKDHRPTHPPDLIILLQHSRNCAASDPRDRIYAFIGLAHSSYAIIPDYTHRNTIEKVLIETAKAIIRHDACLRILQHVNRGRANLGCRLPSWVPDWTSKETTRGIDHGYDWEVARPFCAAGDEASVPEFADHTAVDGEFYEFLKVRAVRVGIVRDVQHEVGLKHILLLTLEEGEAVVGPRAVRHGDEVWVLYGASRPVVLRPEDGNRFAYLGDAIVFGEEPESISEIMYGQMVERVRDGKVREREIWIT